MCTKISAKFSEEIKKMIIVVGFQYRNLEIQGFKKNVVDWIFVFQTITIIGEFKRHPLEILVDILGFLKIFSKFQNSNRNSRISTVSPTIVISQISYAIRHLKYTCQCIQNSHQNSSEFQVFFFFGMLELLRYFIFFS